MSSSLITKNVVTIDSTDLSQPTAFAVAVVYLFWVTPDRLTVWVDLVYNYDVVMQSY
jgi:hypothetical protein